MAGHAGRRPLLALGAVDGGGLLPLTGTALPAAGGGHRARLIVYRAGVTAGSALATTRLGRGEADPPGVDTVTGRPVERTAPP